MARSMWLSIVVLASVASGSHAIILLMIHDPVDDSALVDAVSGQKPVKELAAEIEALEKILLANDKDKIEKLIGNPAPKPEKDYAIPIGQHREFMISGIRYGDEKKNKDHTAYYPIDDFAGVEVSYGIDGTRPQFAVLYFKVDDAFPKLKKVEAKAQASDDRHASRRVNEGAYPELLRYDGPPYGTMDREEVAWCESRLREAGFRAPTGAS